jgi:hypothetical protein
VKFQTLFDMSLDSEDTDLLIALALSQSLHGDSTVATTASTPQVNSATATKSTSATNTTNTTTNTTTTNTTSSSVSLTPQQQALKLLSDALAQGDDTAIVVALRESSLSALLQSVSAASVPLEDLVFIGAMLELLGATLAHWSRKKLLLLFLFFCFFIYFETFFLFSAPSNVDVAFLPELLNVLLEFSLSALHRLATEFRIAFDPLAGSDPALVRLFAQLFAFVDSVCCPDDNAATAATRARLRAAFRPSVFPSLGESALLAVVGSASPAAAPAASATTRAAVDRATLAQLLSLPRRAESSSASSTATVVASTSLATADLAAHSVALFTTLRGAERLLRSTALLMSAAVDQTRNATSTAAEHALERLESVMDQVTGVVDFLLAIQCPLQSAALDPLARLLAHVADAHGVDWQHRAAANRAASLVSATLLGDITRLADSAADFVARNLCVFGAARLLSALAAGDNRVAIACVVGRSGLDASCDVAHMALAWCAALWEETLHAYTLRENGGEAKLVVSDKPWPATQLSPEHNAALPLFPRSPNAPPFALLQQQSARVLQRALLADDVFCRRHHGVRCSWPRWHSRNCVVQLDRVDNVNRGADDDCCCCYCCYGCHAFVCVGVAPGETRQSCWQ